jgi:hypothetical protein
VNEKSRFDIAGLVESALSTYEEQVRIGQSRVKWSPAFSSSESIRVVYSPAVKLVPIRRELRDCLCFNGAYCTVGASNNHSLSLQSERASLYFNL